MWAVKILVLGGISEVGVGDFYLLREIWDVGFAVREIFLILGGMSGSAEVGLKDYDSLETKLDFIG